MSISRAGVEIGEWSEEEVKSMYQNRVLLPSDLYWTPGMPEWLELSRFLKPPPPAPKTQVESFEIKAIPFHVGAFFLPLFFLLFVRRKGWAMAYFCVHFFVMQFHSDYFTLALEIPVMITLGIIGNKLLFQSGKIVTQKDYNWHYGKWAVAGLLLNIGISLLYFLQGYQQARGGP